MSASKECCALELLLCMHATWHHAARHNVLRGKKRTHACARTMHCKLMPVFCCPCCCPGQPAHAGLTSTLHPQWFALKTCTPLGAPLCSTCRITAHRTTKPAQQAVLHQPSVRHNRMLKHTSSSLLPAKPMAGHELDPPQG